MKYRRNYNSAEIFDKYRTAKPSKLFFDLLRQMYRNWRGKRLYKIPDYRKMKYFFYPLQLSKEAALTYMNPFIDQFALIEDIAKALPAGTKLIVKPHGHWRCADIPIDVISKFAKNKDIIMVDPDADTYDLIRNSTAVLTIESTVGFEALVLGKEVVCFGNAFYAQDDIVHKLKRIDGLPLLLKNISEGKSKTDTNKIIKFITTYYKNLIFLEGDIGSYYMLTENDGKNIVDVLRKVVGD
jgi:capsule polysaccharide modification protein KpsS